jgi:hypothetical protein
MQNYGELRQIDSGIWVRDGEWYGTTCRRRMTVMALTSGELVVHNAFILREDDLSRLKSLGRVAGIVMPNALHGDDVGWMAEKFPDALIFTPRASLEKTQRNHRVTGSLENDWPGAWSKSIECLPVSGLRIIHESAFFHKASRSIILTDLVFNIQPSDFKNSLERKLMALNRVGTGFGPSWLCDNLFTKDLEARRQSIITILSRDFNRVIMNHGVILDVDGKAMMRKAFGC